MKRSAFSSLLAGLCFFISLGSNAQAQTGSLTFDALYLKDALNHKIRILPPTSGWPSTGTFDYRLPFPPTGITSGFVQAGSVANPYLQWDNVNGYWKAVASIGLTGSGTANYLTKWSGSSSLTNSLIQDNGSTVTIASGALLLSGSTGSTPASGGGTRMMWIPAKAAFRAGGISGTQWDDAKIGNYSIAMGFDAEASASFAIGLSGVATAQEAIAIGYSTASALGAVAIGTNNVTASGSFSFALGDGITASGSHSFAFGRSVSTNGMTGSFIFGDASTGIVLNNTAAHQFMVRAAGGTIIYSDGATTTGVTLAAGGGSWTSVSDRRKKENFRDIDGEEVLSKIRPISIQSWNYKSQDKTIRHIGPTAQDFYAAFHVGESDTTITTTDIDGVNMIAIQALEKRTSELKEENDKLRSQNNALANKLLELERVVKVLAKEQHEENAIRTVKQ